MPGRLPGRASAGYPAEHECDVALADGTVAAIRPVQPRDAVDLEAFHERLSPETVYRRFMGLHPHLSPGELAYFTQVDYQDRMALVAHLRGRMVAVGRYDREAGTDRAEVAFVVADGLHHAGLGTLLLEHLVGAARRRSISAFYAATLSSNRPMLEVFHHCGLTCDIRWRAGEAEVVLPLEVTESYARAVLERSLHAAHRSLAASLGPAIGPGTLEAPDPRRLSSRAGRDAGHRTLVAADRIDRSPSRLGPRLGQLTVGARRRAPEGAPPATAVATDESGDIDACDVLAYLALGEGVDGVVADVGQVRRPRTFVATAWAALRRTPVAVRCTDPVLARLLAAAGIPSSLGPARAGPPASGDPPAAGDPPVPGVPPVPITSVPGLLDRFLADDPLVPRLGSV